MAISGWMAGRKTYLLAGVLVASVFALDFLGKLTPATAAGVLTLAVSGFAVTFRSALQRHQAEQLSILTAIAQAGGAAAIHNTPGALKAIEAAAAQGFKLGQEIQAERAEGVGV